MLSVIVPVGPDYGSLPAFMFHFFEACRPHADILAVIALIVIVSLYSYAFYVKFHDD